MLTSRKPQHPEDRNASSAARVYGVIDVIRPNRIAGWAIDRADAGAAVKVEILRDGLPVASVCADRFRPDLGNNGLGTGRYGFQAEITPPLEPSFEFTMSAVARASDGETAELKRVGSAASASDPSRRLLEALHGELKALARTLEAVRPQAIADLSELAARIEHGQARLERALESGVPRASGTAGLRALIALSLAVGAVSLGMGLFSLLQG
jgi:hypothetical protein